MAKTAKKSSAKSTAKPSSSRTARAKTAAKKTPTKRVAAKAKKPAIQDSAPKKAAKTVNFFEQTIKNATPKTLEKTMTQGTKQFEQFTQEAANMSRDSVEALIKSSTIFAKGFEDLLKASVSLAQSGAEKQAQLAKEAMSAKTLNEWTALQNKVAQENFNEFMAGATKISEMSAKLLSQASEPINQQMTKSMKKATAAAAA